MAGQMNGHQNHILGEEVDILGPALDPGLAGRHDLGVNKRVEGVDGWMVVRLSPLHQHIHVEVNHLCGRVQSLKML